MPRCYAVERHCSRGAGRSRPGKEPCQEKAEDEPADVGEERDAAPFAWALNSPKFA
jgi:hypothetical protein